MARTEDAAQSSWHLDKRVNISIIAALVAYGVAAIWQQAKIDSRISAVEVEIVGFKRREEEGQRLDREVYSKLASIEATLKILVANMQRDEGRQASPSAR